MARSLTQLVEDAFLIDACASIPHLRDALDEPIAAATETAVDTLIDELADLLDLLPGGFSGEHDPGMHRGFAGWPGCPVT